MIKSVCVVSMQSFRYENGLNDAITRIPFYTHACLDAPLVHDEWTAKEVKNKKFDVLFVRHAPPVWCKYRDIVFGLIKNARKVYYLQNDYAYGPNKQMIDLNNNYEFITTVPSKGIYLNWNKMSYQSFPSTMVKVIPGLFYYGTFRENRIEFFEKYFGKHAKYRINISTFGSKNIISFKNLNNEIRIWSAFDSPLSISGFQMSLYIGDDKSETLYCSPANRFYECLSVNTPMIFDKTCEKTMHTAGFDVRKYVIDDSDVNASIQKFLSNSDEIKEEQRKWHVDYFEQFMKEFNEVMLKIGVL